MLARSAASNARVHRRAGGLSIGNTSLSKRGVHTPTAHHGGLTPRRVHRVHASPYVMSHPAIGFGGVAIPRTPLLPRVRVAEAADTALPSFVTDGAPATYLPANHREGALQYVLDGGGYDEPHARAAASATSPSRTAASVVEALAD